MANSQIEIKSTGHAVEVYCRVVGCIDWATGSTFHKNAKHFAGTETPPCKRDSEAIMSISSSSKAVISDGKMRAERRPVLRKTKGLTNVRKVSGSCHHLLGNLGIQKYIRLQIISIKIGTEHDRELIGSALVTCSEMSGLSQGELEQGLRVKGDLDRRAALQLIELMDHLSALIGNCAIAQSKWLKARNLDLGEVPLAFLNTPSGIESLWDYLAGQRHRS